MLQYELKEYIFLIGLNNYQCHCLEKNNMVMDDDRQRIDVLVDTLYVVCYYYACRSILVL